MKLPTSLRHLAAKALATLAPKLVELAVKKIEGHRAGDEAGA